MIITVQPKAPSFLINNWISCWTSSNIQFQQISPRHGVQNYISTELAEEDAALVSDLHKMVFPIQVKFRPTPEVRNSDEDWNTATPDPSNEMLGN